MLRSLSIVSALSIFNALFPFLLLPILTFQLSLDDYGSLVIIETFIAVLMPFIHFSIAGLMVEYFKLNNLDFKKYIANAIILIIPAFLIFQLLVFIFADYMVVKFGLNKSWFMGLPIIVLMNVFVQAIVVVYQCEKRYKMYATFLLGPNFLMFLLTILMLYFTELGWHSKLIAILISYTVFAMLSLFLLQTEKKVEWKYDSKIISSNLKFSLPLVPHTVSAGLYFMADRLFISHFLGNTSVAIYAAGMQLALVMSVVQNSLSKAWTPFVLEFLKGVTGQSETIAQEYRKLNKQMLIACIFVILIALAIATAIFFAVDFLLPEEYQNSKFIGVMLVGGFCFLGFYKVYSPIIWYHKKTGSLSNVTMIVFVINLVLNFVLIPKFGIYGACYATIISLLFQFVLTKILVLNIVKIHLRELSNAR